MIGGGMSHRMMGRKIGDNFRYLHDEISGGVFAYSHLKCKSSYSGPAVNVNSNDYNFVSGLTPLSVIQSSEAAGAIIYYDQINNYDANSGTGGSTWDGTDYAARGLNAISTSGFSQNFTDPKTFLAVINITSADLGTTQGVCTISNSSSVYQSLVYASSNNLFFRKSNGTNVTVQFSGIRNTGLHLIAWVDNGSLNGSGWEIYYDDMTTVRTPSSTAGTVTNANIINNIGLKNWALNTAQFTGYQPEYHLFNRTLSTAELQTAKDILLQNPDYSTIP